MGLITKSVCISVTDLNQTSRYIGYAVDVCSQLHKTFHDYCLLSVSDQLVVGIVFSWFWLKNYKNIVLRYSLTIKQYFHVEESLNQQKRVWTHSNRVCMTVRSRNKFEKLTNKLCFQTFVGFVYTNHGVWVQASIQNDRDRSLSLKIERNGFLSTNFYTLVAICLKLNDELKCLTASLIWMPKNG